MFERLVATVTAMSKTILCLCRDVTADDVRRTVAAGYDDMETLKRFTGAC